MEQKKFKVLVSDSLAKEGIKILEDHPSIEVDVITKHTPEELIKLVEPYHGIIIRSATTLTREVIAAAKNLKVVVRAGTGYNNIDVEECNKNGVVIMITPLGNTNAVIELTLALMLNYARNVHIANSTMKQDKWEKKRLEGTELKGKTIGIIGLGRIGAGVAKRCIAFEMKVIAYDKFLPKKRAEELGVELCDELDDLLSRADYITIHLPMTPQTKNMIDKPQFEKMKSNAVILNMGRGGIVNEDALYEYLKDNKIGGACMDVFTKEPAHLDKFPFIGLENCLPTPHLGASTKEAQINVAIMAAEYIIKSLVSNIFISAVNLPFKLSDEDIEVYRPFMQLAHDLGRFITQYNTNRIVKVKIRYKGVFSSNFEPLEAVILRSIFEGRLSEHINYMNLSKVLKDNGIEVSVHPYNKSVNFESYIKVYLVTEDGRESKVAGTVFVNQPKIVEIDNLYFDLAPAEYMLVLKNTDTPGVIGQVGTLLGMRSVNIAGLQLGRTKKGSKAVSVFTTDDVISDYLLQELKKLPQIIDALAIKL